MLLPLIAATPMLIVLGILLGFAIYIAALEQIETEDLMKGFLPVNSTIFLVCCCISCGIGDVGTSRTEVSSNSSTDNSTDNSQNGISQCTQGATLVCTPAGPQQVATTQQCINADGSPVILAGPDIVSSAQAATVCPTPEPAPAAEVAPVAVTSEPAPAPTTGGAL